MTLRFLKNRTLLIVAGISLNLALFGQAIPSGPLSIPVYHPLVLNPAFAGSKDFTHISFTTKALASPGYQMLSAHSRLRSSNGSFSNFGLGGYTFLEQLDQSWNTGLSVAGTYHYTLDDTRLHNLSAGAALKGIFTIPKSPDEALEDTVSTTFSPDMDLGFYYYGPNAFAGISMTSVFNQGREFHISGGYKFLLDKSLAIVLEPSLLITFRDSTLGEPTEQLTPFLKLYMQNFYVGTYVKSENLFALFFQYQFPRFYAGVFLEFPWKGYLNDDNIIFELSLGINLGLEKQKFLQHRHW